jgi:pyridoxine 4-dehydrogenase
MTRLRLGDTEVARIGLGTNRLSKTPEHVELIRDAVAAGVQLVDTARTYAGGQSEDTIDALL